MRCATTKLVVSPSQDFITSWIRVSVSTSTELVLSSRIKMDGLSKSARDGKALLLPARKIDAAFFHTGIIAVRQIQNKVMRLGCLRCSNHFLFGRHRLSIAN